MNCVNHEFVQAKLTNYSVTPDEKYTTTTFPFNGYAPKYRGERGKARLVGKERHQIFTTFRDEQCFILIFFCYFEACR